MWRIELATKTSTEDSRIGSQSDTMETMATSWSFLETRVSGDSARLRRARDVRDRIGPHQPRLAYLCAAASELDQQLRHADEPGFLDQPVAPGPHGAPQHRGPIEPVT